MSLADAAGYGELALPPDTGLRADVDDPESYVFVSALTADQQAELAGPRPGDHWVLDPDDPQDAAVLEQISDRLSVERVKRAAVQAERLELYRMLAEIDAEDLPEGPSDTAPIPPRSPDYQGAGVQPWGDAAAHDWWQDRINELVALHALLQGRPSQQDDLTVIAAELASLATGTVLPMVPGGPVIEYAGEPLDVPPRFGAAKVPKQYAGSDPSHLLL